MLSKLSESHAKLFGFIGDWGRFKGMIQPGPKIAMGEQIHPQQGQKIGQRPAELGAQLKEPEDQHGDQCCPNLDLDRIGAGPHKGLDLEVLLQRFEEDLDLPSVLIDGRNRAGPQLPVVAEKDEDLPGVRDVDLDASQEIGASLEGPDSGQPDELVFEHVAMLRDLPLGHDLIAGVILHPGDENRPPGGSIGQTRRSRYTPDHRPRWFREQNQTWEPPSPPPPSPR